MTKIRASARINFGVIFLALVIVSCGHKKTEHSVPDSTPPIAKSQPAPETISMCDSLKSTLPSASKLIVHPLETARIERQFQRVIRHDCSGKLVSDTIQTVRSPHVNLNFKNLSQRPFKAVFVFNQETCESVRSVMPVVNLPLFGAFYAVTGNGKDQISVKGDMASALLTFKLNQGSNHIFVRYFHDCMPSNVEGFRGTSIGSPNCEVSQDFTTVEYPYEIIYSEKTLNGSITMDSDSCEKNKK